MRAPRRQLTTEEESRPRRATGDGGSLIVELALVLPVLAVLLLGIVEFGQAYRERANFSQALRSGARIGTTNGATRSADWLALQGFYSQMAQAKQLTVTKVVIYKSDANGNPTNVNCLTLFTGADCNVYTWAQVSNPGASYLTNFGPTDTSCTGAWDASYCPIARKDRQSDPPDYVGIWATATYKSSTGLMPKTVTMTDRAVFRIDPRVT